MTERNLFKIVELGVDLILKGPCSASLGTGRGPPAYRTRPAAVLAMTAKYLIAPVPPGALSRTNSVTAS